MENDTRDELLFEVLDKTSSRKLAWKEDAAEDSFFAILSGAFRVKSWRKDDGTRNISFERNDGTELFSFSEGAADPEIGTVWQIFDAARDSALGITQAAHDILGQLRKL